MTNSCLESEVSLVRSLQLIFENVQWLYYLLWNMLQSSVVSQLPDHQNIAIKSDCVLASPARQKNWLKDIYIYIVFGVKRHICVVNSMFYVDFPFYNHPDENIIILGGELHNFCLSNHMFYS